METQQSVLPRGFESLTSFVGSWALPDSIARSARRQTATMAEIKAFYDAMLLQAEQAVSYLENVPLGAMAPESENLLKLMLSLAEIAPAVEWYDQQQVYDGFDVTRMRLVRQVSDTAAQL